MTNDEAQQLINLINNTSPVDGTICGSNILDKQTVFKVITRFVNMPPKDGFLAWTDGANIRINHKKDDIGRNIIELQFHDGEEAKVYNFRLGQAERFVVEFNKMLAYLEQE